MSLFVDADIVLRSEFHRGFGLAPHYGADMRLGNTHYPVCHAMVVRIEHRLLLAIQFDDGVQQPGLAVGEASAPRQKIVYEPEIAGKREK